MFPTSIPFLAGTEPTPAADVPEAFGRMVALYKSNARLFAELDSVRRDLTRAQAYRRMPGANLSLADARLFRLRGRQSAVLTLLRANRVEARPLIARLDPVTECA